MKKLICLLVVFMAIMCVSNVTAQEVDQKAKAKANQEELMKTRIAMLKTELNLQDNQMEAFEKVYRKYRGDINHVTDRKATNIKKEELTNENAAAILSARLNNVIATSAVKQRYIAEFSAIIEPLKICKLYKIDERISKEARKIIKYRAEK